MDIVVYKIVDIDTGFCYIGSTENLKLRMKRHYRDFSNGNHHSPKLQKVWSKRPESLKVKILKHFTDRGEAYAYESKLIQRRMLKGKCFNILLGGKGGDALTYHPKRKAIILKRTTTQKAILSSMTDDERRDKYAKYAERNPNWRGGSSKSYCSCGKRMAYSAISCADCRDKSGINNPFYGRSHSKQTKKLLSDRMKGILPANANAIKIGTKKYASQAEAARDLGVSIGTINFRLKSSNPRFASYKRL